MYSTLTLIGNIEHVLHNMKIIYCTSYKVAGLKLSQFREFLKFKYVSFKAEKLILFRQDLVIAEVAYATHIYAFETQHQHGKFNHVVKLIEIHIRTRLTRLLMHSSIFCG